MANKTIKFYDIRSRKPVMVPESSTHAENRRGRNRVIKMLVANYQGRKLYKIVG